MTFARYMVGGGLIVGATGQLSHEPAVLAGGVALGVGAIPVVLLERLHQRRHQAKVMAIAAVEVALGAPGKTRTSVKFEDRTGTTIRKVTVRYPPQIRSHAPAVQAELATAMTHRIGGPVNVRWDHQHCSVVVTRRPILPVRVDHPAGALRDDRSRIPFATGHDGRTVAWDPNSKAPHALITGATGNGKTQTLIGMTIEAANRGFEVHIVDPKMVSLHGLADWPGVVTDATDPAAMVATIDQVHQVMMDRYAELKARTVRRSDLRPVLLVVEELSELISLLAEVHTGRGDHPAVVQWRSLVRLGRQARVHLLCGVQRPDAKIMGGEPRANFGLFVGVGHLTPELQKMIGATGNVTSDTPGRAIAIIRGREQEVQVWWTPDPAEATSSDDQAILDALRPARSKVRSKAVGPPVEGRSDPRSDPRSDGLTSPDTPAVAGGPAPLSPEIVAAIRSRRARGDPLNAIALELGVGKATVVKYARGAPEATPERPALHVVKES